LGPSCGRRDLPSGGRRFGAHSVSSCLVSACPAWGWAVDRGLCRCVCVSEFSSLHFMRRTLLAARRLYWARGAAAFSATARRSWLTCGVRCSTRWSGVAALRASYLPYLMAHTATRSPPSAAHSGRSPLDQVAGFDRSRACAAYACACTCSGYVHSAYLSTRGMYDMYVGAAASLHSFDSGCICVTFT
jgi:hypothetical protein